MKRLNVCIRLKLRTTARSLIMSAMQVCADVLDRAVFQCGPPSLTKAVSAGLASIGFPLENLHEESFYF